MSEKTFDVVILGGGAGGFPAAIRSAQLGGHVAIIESRDFGGLCMNRGCIPFCHMAAASRFLGSLPFGKEMGIEVSGISHNYASLKKRQTDLMAFMREGVKGMLGKNKVRILQGKGTISGKGTIDVNGETIRARNLIVATGSRWVKPNIPGSDRVEVMNSDDLLGTKALPQRVLIYDTSPWSLEIAQFLNHFGSQVILATDAKNILPLENKSIRSRISKVLKKQGIGIKTRLTIQGMNRKKDGLHVSCTQKDRPETIVVDQVICLKRKGALEGLGLSSVGLDEGDEFIKVNDRMQTAVDGIYAVGDIAAHPDFHYSHAASAGGIIAAENAMGRGRTFNPRTIARILFTSPEIACIGLTEKEAKQAGYDVVVGAAPLSMNPYGMILSQNEGIIEVVSEKEYGEILGVHMVGSGACEMAGLGVLAIQMEMTLKEMTRTTLPHPTLSESLTEAARKALGQSIYIP